MSGIVGSLNTRGSGLINIGSASDGQVFTGTGAGLPVGFEAAAGGGKVLQVVSTTKTDTFSLASTTLTDITGFSVAITPAATSSKILIFGHINDGLSGSSSLGYRILRDSTAIGIAAAASSRLQLTSKQYHAAASHSVTTSYSFLDSPSSTSEITYKIQMGTQSGQTGYINRTHGDTDDATIYDARTQSTITVMEIGT